MISLFSHTDDLHSESTSDLEHYLTEPFIAVPIFVLVVIGIYYGLKLVGVPPQWILIVELAFLLMVGILTYSLVPAVSIIALSAGILIALLVTLSLLASG